MAEKSFILLTTSRRPARNTRTFCRNLSNILPNVVRINRGKLSLNEVAEKALELDAEKAVIVDRWKGGPGKIQFFRISEKGLDAVPPLVYLRSIKLCRDFGEGLRGRRIESFAITASKRGSLEVKRLGNVLAEFFSIPVLSIKEIYNREFDAAMQILSDSSNRIVVTFKLVPELVEVGPQVRVAHLVWELT